MTLYREVRPKVLDEIVGNDEIKSALKGIIKSDPKDRPHAFIFHGPTGSGKTTFARILANAFGCTQEDIEEYDAADTRGIDTIRKIKENSSFAPFGGKARVAILDESHQLTPAAMEGLLKLLEDPPEHFYIILCTTNLSKIIDTIKKGRTTIFQVERLRPNELATLLDSIITLKEWEVDKEVLDCVIDEAEGIPRQALTLLEKVAHLNKEEALTIIEKSSESSKEIIDLCREIIKVSNNKQKKWIKVRELYKRIEADPEQVRRGLLGYLGKVLLNENNEYEQLRLFEMVMVFEPALFYSGKAGLVNMLYRVIIINE